MTTLDKHTDADLREFIELWNSIERIDTGKAYALARAARKYYKGDATQRANIRHLRDLETRWYASLATGYPAYSLYNDQYILSDIWACWTVYSRPYLRNIEAHIIPQLGVQSVIDLGCGFGYTTAALKEMFPHAEVFGTQFEDCTQWKVAKVIGERSGFTILPKPDKRCDLVFASEYFEHIERPLEHLRSVLEICRPKYFLIANSFNTISMGHFEVYKHHDGILEASKVSRHFNRMLAVYGFEQEKTNFWNNRPAFWRYNAHRPSLFTMQELCRR